MMGESIAMERAKSDAERLALPTLDIEAEINMALKVSNSTKNGSKLGQIMKDLGAKRLQSCKY